MKKLNLAVLVLVLFMVMLSCKKDNPAPDPTSLEITLTDNLGNVVSFANVKLFNSLTDWQNQTNQIDVQTSGIDGKVTFTNLQSIKYYWFAENGCKNNYFGSATLTNPLPINTTTKITSVLDGTGALIFVNNSTNPYHVYINGSFVFDMNGGTTIPINYEPTGSYTLRVVQISGYAITPTDKTYTGTLTCGGSLTTTFPN